MTTDAIKAFVKAQSEMGKALKTTKNDHFKSRYADLSSVQEACFPALNANGFVVMQPSGWDDHGEYVETKFLHETGAEFLTRIYLKVGKPDMQGYGSAITYARRYGLMSLAGIAPEDDDGNAASRFPPRSTPHRAPEPPHDPQTGEIQSNGNAAHAAAQGLRDTWEDGVLDRLPENANPREKAEAFAAQIIADFDNYKTMRGLRGYCSGKNKYFIRFETTYPDIAAQVQEAFDRAEVRINGDDPIVLGDVQATDDAGRPL